MVQMEVRAATTTASNVHCSLGEIRIARNAAARPQALFGWISVHLLSPFHLLQPSIRPKLVLANIYLLLSSRSASTVFPLGCCSFHTLTCLYSDLG